MILVAFCCQVNIGLAHTCPGDCAVTSNLDNPILLCLKFQSAICSKYIDFFCFSYIYCVAAQPICFNILSCFFNFKFFCKFPFVFSYSGNRKVCFPHIHIISIIYDIIDVFLQGAKRIINNRYIRFDCFPSVDVMIIRQSDQQGNV